MNPSNGEPLNSEKLFRQLMSPAPESEARDVERLWASFTVIDAALSIAIDELPVAAKEKIAGWARPLREEFLALARRTPHNRSRLAGVIRALNRVLRDLQ